jgi:adenine-specific DNA methylase
MYSDIKPIETHIPAVRQGAKRHYGVHPYFTRRPYNVVRSYILHYTKEGDCVLDPFGGSGVTAVEAFLENRIAVHNDINPLANFIAAGIANLADVTAEECHRAVRFIEAKARPQLEKIARADEHELDELKTRLPLPPNICLPADSDAKCYFDLFTPRQLVSMAVLRQAVDEIDNPRVKDAMLLAWSATLAKQNKTFLSAKY